MFKIPEKYTMHHKDRISGVAYRLFGAYFIPFLSKLFCFYLSPDSFYDDMQHDKMSYRYPAAHDAEYAPPDTELLWGKIYGYDSYPEDNAFYQYDKSEAYQLVGSFGYYPCRTAKPFLITAEKSEQ